MQSRTAILELGRQELEELTLRLVSLQNEWSEVNIKRNAWLVILGGDPDTPAEAVVNTASDTANSPAAEEAAANDPTVRARQIIAETGEGGFKPRDITKRLKTAGLAVGSGFVSNLLFRMKRKNEVVEHNGKYYIPKFDPKPRLQMNVGA